MARCYLTTPQFLSSAIGRLLRYTNKGELRLDEDTLTFAPRHQNWIVIPLRAITSLSIGDFPAGISKLKFISVTFTEKGNTHRFFFVPHPWRPPFHLEHQRTRRRMVQRHPSRRQSPRRPHPPVLSRRPRSSPHRTQARVPPSLHQNRANIHCRSAVHPRWYRGNLRAAAAASSAGKCPSYSSGQCARNRAHPTAAGRFSPAL
jgi:hypothetical protein